MRALSTIAIISLLLSACFVGEELPPDQDIWEYGLPSETGLSDSSLLALNTAIRFGTFDPVRSLVIIKDDKLVFENYFDESDRATVRNLGRTSPIVTVLALGIAIEEGLLSSIDQRIVELLPVQYQSLLTGEKQDITLEHLLTHRSGLSWNESVFNLGLNDPGNDLNMLANADDPIVFLLSKPLEATPGIRFNFNTGTSVIISRIIASLSEENFEDYVEERIFRPLEIENYTWETDVSDNINTATGLGLTMIDLAKVGYLYLQEGRWRNQQIVFEEWISAAGSTQIQISNTFNYGYYWQTFSDNISFVPLTQPNDAYFMSQHIYINPSQNLLIIFGTDDILLGTVSSPLLAYREVIWSLVF